MNAAVVVVAHQPSSTRTTHPPPFFSCAASYTCNNNVMSISPLSLLPDKDGAREGGRRTDGLPLGHESTPSALIHTADRVGTMCDEHVPVKQDCQALFALCSRWKGDAPTEEGPSGRWVFCSFGGQETCMRWKNRKKVNVRRFFVLRCWLFCRQNLSRSVPALPHCCCTCMLQLAAAVF